MTGTGTWSNVLAGELGILGRCLQKGDAQVTFPGLTFPADISISAWFKAPQPFDGIGVSVGFDDLMLKLISDPVQGNGARGQITQQFNVDYPYGIPGTVWFHVVLTLSRDGNWVFYVSGEQYDIGPVDLTDITTSAFKIIGSTDVDTSPLDEVGVWNRILTLSEVQTLYNTGDGFDPTA